MLRKENDGVNKCFTVRRYSDVTGKPVEWLWNGFLPAGMLTMLDGDPGIGKSLLTCDLAARLTTGREMPTGTRNAPATVMLLSAEDDPERSIKSRLTVAGANQDRVLDVQPGPNGLAFPRDMDALERGIREHRTRLCVIDPLAAFADATVKLNLDQDVRRLMSRFRTLAERTRCAVLIVRHLNKGEGKALYRGGGSIGIIGAARVGLLAAIDPADKSRVILAVSKSNVGPKPKSVAYTVKPVGGQPTIGWLGEVDVQADDLVREKRPDGVRGRCVEFLRGLLANGPITGAAFERALGERPEFKPATVGRAKAELGATIYWDVEVRDRMFGIRPETPEPDEPAGDEVNL